MFLLNDKPLPLDTPFTVGDGDEAIQYPANWLRLATAEDRVRLGITEVPDPVRANDRFYWNGDINNPKALEDRAEVDKDGQPILNQKGEQLITKGLKSQFIAQVKHTAGLMLSNTDWMVIRKVERDINIPSNVATYRASVVAKTTELETAISAVTTVEQLIALDLSFPNEA